MMYLWVFIGAMILIGAIIWAMFNNRQTPREYRRTEDATRDLYQAEDEKNKAEGR